ncbi:unknown [Crocosphaera subtropica ATCC 51142]|uniref:Xylose isomerase-like TIM barrel domain-containing protein n=1 Tax=Crocosphaera subtropica (strain ATCC 51142 / BH68) TaxID=43989 RepID=B1WUF0_CROS5|nr:metabolite traffic protein EboE [Crocosphaera subtropica]ACB53804.1 unknown [Crocosphaera subtropica ATCC 51142]
MLIYSTKNRDRPYHLTYCSNIHPGEDWEDVFKNLQTYIPKLKKELAPDAPFGIGLRLANTASEELLRGDNLEQLKHWLMIEDCYVFTLNGFPYGGFHRQVVKDHVYRPDWSEGDRLTYTERLLKILAELLPEAIDGGISTVPLSYKPWWQSNPDHLPTIFEGSSFHLAEIAAQMAKLEEETGKLLHLDLEPEPDALLENTDEAIAFFENWLLPVGQGYLQQKYGVTSTLAETWLRRHIRVCYDTCHFAVEYEDPAIALAKFEKAGIAIGKFQISSAIRIPIPPEKAQRQVLKQHLEPFAESTYLHQVIEKGASGTLNHYQDLQNALLELMNTSATEWRTHFHVPIFIDRYPPFNSTQDHITDILQQLDQAPQCNHLEIETYTWEVLPSEMKLDIFTSIKREYEWILNALS